MGLDLVCGSLSIKMGSYGYVHVQRWGWLQAQKLYLLSKASTSVEREQIETLFRPCLLSLSKFSPKLDYDYIRRHLQSYILPGVFTFVYHSDCEGYWTPEECQEMIETINILRPFFYQVSELRQEIEKKSNIPSTTTDIHDEVHDGYYYLEPIFQHAIQHQRLIECC